MRAHIERVRGDVSKSGLQGRNKERVDGRPKGNDAPAERMGFRCFGRWRSLLGARKAGPGRLSRVEWMEVRKVSFASEMVPMRL